MWRARRPRILRNVESNPITASLELDASADAPTGRLSAGNGFTRDFAGWLGLVAAIDALVHQATHPANATSGETQ
jgi:hypothetical protein